MQLDSRLEKRVKMNNLRVLKTTPHLLDFSSNDYLGLARSSTLFKEIQDEWRHLSEKQSALGSTGSRLLTGNSEYVEALEKDIAAFHGFETGLIFGSGYMANLGLIQAISTENDCLFFDSECHASMRDGFALSRAKAVPFKHNDLNHLEKRFKSCHTIGKRFVFVESIYSTDGSVAPLKELCDLSSSHNVSMIVDEAHAVGICGTQGRGLVHEVNVTDKIFGWVAPFGKAVGCYGAIVAGSALLKTLLTNYANSFIYTTALPYYNLAALKCSYKLFPKMDAERSHVRELIRICKEYSPGPSMTHIQPIYMQGNDKVKKHSTSLLDKGFDVRPLLSPTVRSGHERLRLSLHAHNDLKDLTELLKYMNIIKM